MPTNKNLYKAKSIKLDEFYTQYGDIENEMEAYYEYDHDVFRGKTILLPCDDPEMSNFTKYFTVNFTRFGIKRLISTSYKYNDYGKIFTLTQNTSGSGNINTDNIEFMGYLVGDGDFRSEEVTALRDEADIIITNPPFSMFREFFSWIMEGGRQKQFVILGNMNAITYKDVFPFLKNNEVWLGYSIHSGDRKFTVPDSYSLEAANCGIDGNGHKYIRVKGVRWFTNLNHGLCHKPLLLDTMAHNLKFNKKLKKKLINNYGQEKENLYYPKYDNYDAIEVPVTKCIPSDYDGVMGVPISFLDKYCPEQFEIVKKINNCTINGKHTYVRILIRKKG